MKNFSICAISMLSLLFAACRKSETVEPDPWGSVPIVGQWELCETERYAPDGTLVEHRYVDYDEQIIIFFNEAGFFRYFDRLGEQYDGSYTYDPLTKRLDLDAAGRHTAVAASYREECMRWSYEADESGYRLVEYYVVYNDSNLPAPPEKEEDVIARIPDPVFKAYMVRNFDTDGDGEISAAEAACIERIAIYDQEIASLEGIEYCTALTLLNCRNNQLTTLDVSRNTTLEYLVCNDNQLTSLDVSRNTALTELLCYGNQLTSLDVNRNTALEYLSCGSNQLTTLDVSNCLRLEYLILSPMPSLKTLYMAKGQIIDNNKMSIPETTEIIRK